GHEGVHRLAQEFAAQRVGKAAAEDAHAVLHFGEEDRLVVDHAGDPVDEFGARGEGEEEGQGEDGSFHRYSPTRARTFSFTETEASSRSFARNFVCASSLFSWSRRASASRNRSFSGTLAARCRSCTRKMWKP